MNFKVKKIDHIGIVVKSIDKALKLYSDFLNLKLGKKEELKDRGLKIQILKIGETNFELLEPIREDSEVSKFLEKRGEGIHHIALSVDNIESAFEESKKLGFKIIGDTIQTGLEGKKVFFLHPKSTGGILIEFVEGGSENGR